MPDPATMSTKKFEDFLVSRCEYLKCVVAGGVLPGSKPHVTLSKQVLDMASRQLNVLGVVDCTTASRLVDIVTSSTMMPEDKHELIVRLNVKVDLDECADGSNPGGPSSGSGGASSGSVELAPVEHPTLAATPKKQKQISQEHHYLHNYGPAYLWEVICSKTAPLETKLSAMALFLYLLGMRWPAEKTAAAATSLCRHFTVLPDDTPDKALLSQRKMKEKLRLLWKDKPPCDVPCEYPETPEEFSQRHPSWYQTAYARGPPIPSPVPWQEALLMYAQQPCRSTKLGCSAFMRSRTDVSQLASYGWSPSLQMRMNQLQLQDTSFGPQNGGPADLPWLKICTPQRQVAVPEEKAPCVPPAAGGGVLMMDINTGGGAVAGAPALQPDAAALAPVVQAPDDVAASAEPNAAAAAPLGPEAAAVTPRLVNGLIAIKDQEPQLKPSAAKPQMHNVAMMLREKILADKLEAKRQRDALKEKEQKQAEALKKMEEKEAKAAPQKAAAVTGKAKAAAKKLVKVDAAKATHKAAAKVVPKGGSCPDDSLVYRGPAYAQVRYYKQSTIYHDAINHQWRVKPITGSRQTIKKSFKTNPKQAWEELVCLVRKLNA